MHAIFAKYPQSLELEVSDGQMRFPIVVTAYLYLKTQATIDNLLHGNELLRFRYIAAHATWAIIVLIRIYY